jgi:tetratricopeptide (TPR) repeat protein
MTHQEDISFAESLYKRTLRRKWNHYLALVYYADLLEHFKRDFATSAAFLERAIQIEPDGAGYISHKLYAILAYTRLDAPLVAQSILEHIVERDPSDVIALVHLARVVRLRRGDLNAARLYLKAAQTLTPTFQPALVEAAQCAIESGDFSEAAHLAAEALALDDGDSQAHAVLALALVDDGVSQDLAEFHFLKALELDKNNSFALLHYAAFLSNVGNVEVSEELLLRAENASGDGGDGRVKSQVFTALAEAILSNPKSPRLKSSGSKKRQAALYFRKALAADASNARAKRGYDTIISADISNVSFSRQVDMKREVDEYRDGPPSPSVKGLVIGEK